MPDWTAITGIVVSGAVGPSVIAFWAGRRQKREAAHAIALADRGAARALVDDAAEAVREARGRAGAVHSATITWGRKLGIEGGKEQMERFNKAGQRVDLLAPRVNVMFGSDSPVTTAYAECLAATERVSRAANLLSGAPVEAEMREFYDDIKEGSEEIGPALDRFVAAAHDAVGLR